MLTLPYCGENYNVCRDASMFGFGCVLMNGRKVIAYALRQLKVYENIYPTHNLELAAMVFALRLWRHYFYEVHMDVFTDHKSIQYMFTQRELNLCHQRWL